MFQTLSRTCLDKTLINKQVNYYICVCYHRNLTLHKDGFNNAQIFWNDQSSKHFWIARLTKYLCEISQKRSPKSRIKTWNLFVQFLPWKTVWALFSDLFWDSVLKYFKKKNHFKVNDKSRPSNWHINKNLKTYIKSKLLLNQPDIL